MRRGSRVLKVVAAAAVLAAVGAGGATIAGSQDGDDEGAIPAAISPAAINPDLDAERHFVPVTACRAVDTRVVGGILAADTSRGFDIFGTDLSHQGGDDEGCDIPTHADTVAINLISTQPTGTGFLRGSAQNISIVSPTAPSATLLSFATGPNRSNEVPIRTCRPGIFACSGGDEIRLWAFQSSTHVVVDVLGYYVTPVYGTVEGDAETATLVRGNGVTAVTRVGGDGSGSYDIDVNRDLRGCAVVVSIGNSNEEAAAARFATVDQVSTTDFDVELFDATGAPADADFSFIFHC